MKLHKIDLTTILGLIAILSFFVLMIIINFYFDSLIERDLVWLIVYSSLLIICTSISGTIIFTTVEPEKTFEINSGFALILGFLIIWGFFGFSLNPTFFIILSIILVFLIFGWILGKSSYNQSN